VWTNVYTWIDLHTVLDDTLLLEKKSAKPEPGECLPPEYLLPGCKDRPLVPLHPIHKELRVGVFYGANIFFSLAFVYYFVLKLYLIFSCVSVCTGQQRRILPMS